MVSKETLEDIKHRLVKAYDPIAIYLFGSYAWGTPDEESDLDLLVVVEKSEEKSFRRPLVGYKALRGLELIENRIIETKEKFTEKI